MKIKNKSETGFFLYILHNIFISKFYCTIIFKNIYK